MKFTLVEADIKQAIEDYIGKIITINPSATIDIDIKATRGADGVTAEIDVALAGSVKAESAPVAKPVVEEAIAPAAVKPITPPAVEKPIQQPIPEQLATATAPAVEPGLDNVEDEAFEPETAFEETVPPVPGKSIFG